MRSAADQTPSSPISSALVASAVIAATGGFLFGFDTVVISGAEQKIQSLWKLSDAMHGFAISAALWGTVLGSIVGAWPADRWGRKRTLLVVGILYTVSAVWSGLAGEVYALAIARFIGGVGVGIATVAAPMYIAEISPPAWRGRLTAMFQFNIVFGILMAYVSNSLLRGRSENDWRWMLGMEAFPAFAYTFACLAILESPRWLIGVRGDRAAGLAVFRKVNPALGEAELASLADAVASHPETSEQRDATKPFWNRRLARPILLAFLVAMFNQLSGINAILYFAPRILGMAGFEENAAFIQTIGMGVTNLIFTMFGIWLIDRVGRRTLLFVGSIGYIVSLGLIAAIFINNDVTFRVTASALSARDAYAKLEEVQADSAQPTDRLEELRATADKSLAALNVALSAADADDFGGPVPAGSSPEAALEPINAVLQQSAARLGVSSQLMMAGLFLFIAAHAIGSGTVIWVLIAEVFPNEHRAAGQSLGSATHWVFAALLTLVFPLLVTQFSPGYVFGFFCAMMVLQLWWVIFLVPETKGVALEELQAKLTSA